jgi:hypothetical protein
MSGSCSFDRVDDLGVAAALDVEHALVAPAVLVVADEQALGIGRQRGLAGARQAEQHRGVGAVAGLGRRAVHRQHAALGHEVVHDREHPLLHLAGVLAAEDDELATAERQVDRRGGGHARGVLVGGEAAGVEDDVVGRAEAVELGHRRADQHVVHEQRVVRAGAHDADLEPVGGIPAGEAVDDVQPLAGVQVVDRPLAVDREALRVELDVDVAPPHVVANLGLVDDALVGGAATGLLAGVGDERAGGRDGGALLVAERGFVQERRGGVTVDLGDGDAVGLEREVGHGSFRSGWGSDREVYTTRRSVGIRLHRR